MSTEIELRLYLRRGAFTQDVGRGLRDLASESMYGTAVAALRPFAARSKFET
jgi:hypothetical protein